MDLSVKSKLKYYLPINFSLSIKHTFLFSIIILLFLIPAAQAGWTANNSLSDGQRPKTFSLNVSSAAGTNNATHVFCSGNCNTNLSDVYFTQNGLPIYHYIDPVTPGKVWVNVTGNGTLSILYGFGSNPTPSNATNTFQFFDHYTSNDTTKWSGIGNVVTSYSNSNVTIGSGVCNAPDNTLKSYQTFPMGTIADFYINPGTSTGTGACKAFGFGNGALGAWYTNFDGWYARNDGWVLLNNGAEAGATNIEDSAWGVYSVQKESASVTRFLKNDVEMTSSPINPTFEGSSAIDYYGGTTMIVDWVRVRTMPGTWATWGAASNIIESWGNNYTNNANSSISLTANTIVKFNLTAPTATSYTWEVNSVDQSTNASNFTYNFNTVGTFIVEGTATNTTESSTIFWTITLPLSLTSPANASTINYDYPPIQTPVAHTWGSAGYPYYNIRISTDPNFNYLVVDAYTSAMSYTTSLSPGKYYWKVRDYNTDTMTGTWSATREYTITSNSSATGVGIQGVVYEMVGGVQTPISGATVYLYNNTLSSSVTTGSNGYYIFTGLANSTTYNIYVSKQGYETTAIFPVTTGINDIQTKDILMKIYISPYVPNFVFEKFIVRGLFDNPFPGVTVNVYKGSEINPSFTGTTDSLGQVVFQLVKDQYYRVTFSGGGLSNTITKYIYAKEESYLLTVITGFPTGGNRSADISINLTSTVFNATYNNLSLAYADSKNSTSIINFYATNITTGENCFKNSTSQATTISCTVLASGTYRFGFNATSSIYGLFQEDRVINFAAGNSASPMIPTKVTATLMHWGSVMLIVLTASLFSVRSVKFGALVVPGLALVVWAFGWLQAPILLLSVAMALGVMVYMRASEVKVNY